MTATECVPVWLVPTNTSLTVSLTVCSLTIPLGLGTRIRESSNLDLYTLFLPQPPTQINFNEVLSH